MSHILESKKTIIVVGPGGVGKTTSSAALAVHAARMGKKVLVLTVDPARRLANSLGLDELGNTEVEIEPKLFEEAGVPLTPQEHTGLKGRLFGMMLDVKSTFDELIIRHAPNEDVRRKILTNPLYIQGSSAMAGSQEYMAMEKLYEIRETRDYDFIVLDTPPTANALDFLNAADKLEGFFGSNTAKILMQGAKTAGRFGLGLLKMNNIVMRGLGKFVGADLLASLLEFLTSFQDMYAGFKQRAGRVKEILRSSDVAFLIVTSTESAAIDEALFFYDQLKKEGMPFGAMLVNRVRQQKAGVGEAKGLAEHLLAVTPPIGDAQALARVAQAVEVANHEWELIAKADAGRVAILRQHFERQGDGARVIPIPLFERDIHDIGALSAYGELIEAALTKVS